MRLLPKTVAVSSHQGVKKPCSYRNPEGNICERGVASECDRYDRRDRLCRNVIQFRLHDGQKKIAAKSANYTAIIF